MRARRFIGLVSLVVWMPARAQATDEVRPEDQTGTRAAGPSAPGTSAFANALRLARMLNDDRVVAQLLASRALAPEASASDLADVVEALEAVGDPGRAARLLERRIALFPSEPATRIQLAMLLMRMGRSRDAVPVWRELDKHVGPGGLSASQADSYARALARSGASNEARRVLEAALPVATDESADYWSDLGELAWQHGDDAEALTAYAKLWAMHETRPPIGERLLTLLADSGARDEAIAVGFQDYRAHHTAASLLHAARLESDRGDWAEVKRALVEAEDDRAVAQSADYWLLRGETHGRLGEGDASERAYRSALAIDPESTEAKTAVLWAALDRGDLKTLASDVARWRAGADREPAIWGAYAAALDRLGRSKEALAFYARLLRSHPDDHGFLPDFAAALARVGRTELAARVRRQARARLRAEAVAALADPKPSVQARGLIEDEILAYRETAGAGAADRWIRRMLARRGHGDADTAGFLFEWCLGEENLDCARRALARAPARLGEPRVRQYRLQLALADDDTAAMQDLLSRPAGLDPADRLEASLQLDDDAGAATAITEALARNPIEGEKAWREQLAAIAARHAPSVAVGASYFYDEGVDVYGPDVSASHDVGEARITYAAAGREMTTRAGTLLLDRIREADFFASARITSSRGAIEAGLGANIQADTPLPRASLAYDRLLTGALGLTVHAAVDDRIDDTGLLRVAAAQSVLELSIRDDDAPRAYWEIDLHGREDHTRRFHYVGAEIGEAVEAGFKLLRADPEWDLGVQALAHQRRNAAALPADMAPFVPTGPNAADLDFYLPPSYELLSVVSHLVHGDFRDRYRADRGPYPRYDCSLELGLLFPDHDLAAEGRCAVAIRTFGAGTMTAIGLLNRGITGIANQTNAEAALTYTLAF